MIKSKKTQKKNFLNVSTTSNILLETTLDVTDPSKYSTNLKSYTQTQKKHT